MFSQFQDFHSVEQLHNEGFSDIPEEKGIYVVMKPKDMDIEFTVNTTAIDTYNGQSLLYDPNILLAKYEKSDKKVMYMGKAGGENSSLRQRIRQLVQYGYLMYTNHRGGRAIWQINDNRRLLIGYMEIDNPEEAEKELLNRYLNEYGILPVANWRIG